MSDKEKEYFIPEQLDDNDFEKEKKEEKRNKKEKKFEFNKKQVIKIISIILVIVLIGFGIYLYLNPIEKKATAPEVATEDFCAYFNSGNWEKLNNMMDLKGYYVLGAVLEEADYTEFDSAYKQIKESDKEYTQYLSMMDTIMNIDKDALDEMAIIQIKLNNIESCTQIQGTNTLYKLRVNFDYIYNGQTESITDVIYISNASGEYKMVYGEWMKTVLNYYQSIYMIQNNYGY